MTTDAPQHVSPRGLVFKVQREAIVTVPYEDGEWREGPRKGEKKYSIGCGSQTPEVYPDDPPLTTPEIIARLRADVAAREVTVNRALKVIVTQGAFDALVSIYYQRGSEPLKAIAELYNSGEPVWAVAKFWDYRSGANGVVTKGHTLRRLREMIMAADDNYGDQTFYPFYNGDPRKVAKELRPVRELGLL